MKERVALFPGSFNPFTIGHKNIVERASGLFDKVIVAIGYNEHKGCEVDCETRMTDIREAVSDIVNVEVTVYRGLTVDYAKECGASYIVRGVRDTKDYEYERNIADVNRSLTGIETVILCALPELGFVSSSVVRELSHNGADVSRFLPGKVK